jgi:hypothetical protein
MRCWIMFCAALLATAACRIGQPTQNAAPATGSEPSHTVEPSLRSTPPACSGGECADSRAPELDNGEVARAFIAFAQDPQLMTHSAIPWAANRHRRITHPSSACHDRTRLILDMSRLVRRQPFRQQIWRPGRCRARALWTVALVHPREPRSSATRSADPLWMWLRHTAASAAALSRLPTPGRRRSQIDGAIGTEVLHCIGAIALDRVSDILD